jgi:hypothetical protein
MAFAAIPVSRWHAGAVLRQARTSCPSRHVAPGKCAVLACPCPHSVRDDRFVPRQFYAKARETALQTIKDEHGDKCQVVRVIELKQGREKAEFALKQEQRAAYERESARTVNETRLAKDEAWKSMLADQDRDVSTYAPSIAGKVLPSHASRMPNAMQPMKNGTRKLDHCETARKVDTVQTLLD